MRRILSHYPALPNAEEMRGYDASCMALGTDSLTLMERAAQGVHSEITTRFRHALAQVVVLCGSGNNGGDGVALSRLLHESKVSVVTIVTSATRYSDELLTNLERLIKKGGAVCWFGNEAPQHAYVAKLPRCTGDHYRTLLESASLVVDALLGTGQKNAPRGAVAQLISTLNEVLLVHKIPVVAIDLPTGCDSDTGGAYEPHVTASCTIAIQCVKRGLVQYPARTISGVMQVIDIGIPCTPAPHFSLFKASPRARAISPGCMHKGAKGSVLVIGGSPAYPGAPLLSARAALVAGAGLVSVAHPAESPYLPLTPELIVRKVSSQNGIFDTRSAEQLEPHIARADVIVLGPGLGDNATTVRFVVECLAHCHFHKKRVVLDADGLNALAVLRRQGEQVTLPAETILTPHPGEAARLIGVKSEQIQSDRYSAVTKLYQLYRAVVVLKGAGTIVFDGEFGTVDQIGGEELATAGSGDVLSGIIAARVATGGVLSNEAGSAVLLHSSAGRYASAHGTHAIIASDIIAALPHAEGEIA